MTITTLSSRELNQDVGRAKRATADGPVFITTRGKRTQVLLSYEEYERLTGGRRTLAALLAMPDGGKGADVELDIPPRQAWRLRIPDFD